ncbi:hypothetical protein CSKR_203327 [Clonorchis sinensis]|uniref:Uncharacterized protein n=2 Tax=Clonorchis sinensis TaxID=79923 RepID=A0A8T1M9R2_CLOSI|nr:hypothetical protein CSKR_203327 [Clonorchis sinensis]
MDKELKSKLKDAKKSYQKGEYDECRKLTQEILAEDSKSYQALVLKAACCDQLEFEDEAADCFFLAINVDPGSMLAWQGLLQLCTKNLDRFYQTAVCVCLELMKFYTEPQFEEKRLSCIRLLIEVLVRYRLEASFITGYF